MLKFGILLGTCRYYGPT